jgi:UDP-glucose 4-epimerase
MRVLLTGSTGFIGRRTLRHLLHAGHEVRPTDRKPDPNLWTGGVWYDLQDFERAHEMFRDQGFGAVIHLAANASLQRSLVDPVYDARNNIISTLNLIRLCQKFQIPKLVFSSTSAVYSKHEKPPYKEGASLAPISPYGISKLACEMYLNISGLDVTILRYGNVYGPEQQAVGENALVARALDHIVGGKPFVINGDGEQTRDWIYVDDIAAANEKAMNHKGRGVYNIASGEGRSVNDVVRLLCDARNYDFEGIAHGPAKPGELTHVVLSTYRSRMHLQWMPVVSLEQGLEWTAKSWA